MLGLKFMRLINEMTLKELAYAIGVKHSLISCWENELKPIPKKRLVQLAAVLDTDPEMLIREFIPGEIKAIVKLKVPSGQEYMDELRKEYPKADALYEDTIIKAVGAQGLQKLREEHLIESCAVLEGRKLYAL